VGSLVGRQMESLFASISSVSQPKPDDPTGPLIYRPDVPPLLREAYGALMEGCTKQMASLYLALPASTFDPSAPDYQPQIAALTQALLQLILNFKTHVCLDHVLRIFTVTAPLLPSLLSSSLLSSLFSSPLSFPFLSF